MGLRYFALGFASCALLFVGCASRFPFKHYWLAEVDYSHGMLVGEKPEDDVPFGRCEPVPGDKNPCSVVFTADWFRLKQEYIDTQNKLKACEKALAQCSQ